MKGIEVVFTWETKRGIRTKNDNDFDNEKKTLLEKRFATILALVTCWFRQ